MQIYFYIIGVQENKDSVQPENKISKAEKKKQANKSYYQKNKLLKREYYQRNKLLMRGNNKNSLNYNHSIFSIKSKICGV